MVSPGRSSRSSALYGTATIGVVAAKGPGRRGSRRPAPDADGIRQVARNRRARHDYDILETFECGIALQGSEVKSLRAGKVSLQDSFARVDSGELWLHGVHIPPYDHASAFGTHDPDRRRKLLVHRGQIDELTGRTQQQALTMVPLSIYFKEGRAKVELALARGRKLHDKRHAIAERDATRDAARDMARAASWSAGRGSRHLDGA